MLAERSTVSDCTLSFCIPTYNRSLTVVALVRLILKCPAPDIEVVVLDNGSTDDTLLQLEAIMDPRLVVSSNGINRGVLFNVVNVMLHGCGRYSVLVLDKDFVDPMQIELFRDFLVQTNPACGFCEYGAASAHQPETYQLGIDALRNVAYSTHHPTGYFFRTSLLHELNIASRFTEYDYVGHFPFEFIQAECCLLGQAAIYHPPVFATETLSSAAIKSFGTNAANEEAFFSPKGRLKMAINFSIHIKSLSISQSEQRELILKRFTQGLLQSTFGYRSLMGSEIICRHYHVASRKMSAIEVLRMAWMFYRGFSLALIHSHNGELQLSNSDIFSFTFRRLCRSIKRRLSTSFYEYKQ